MKKKIEPYWFLTTSWDKELPIKLKINYIIK